VEVRLGETVAVERGRPRLGGWTPGTVILATGLEGARGRDRVEVDATFRPAGWKRTLVVGDAARVPGAVASAQHAVQEGRHAARVIEAFWKGGTPPPFRPSTLGELVTVGGGDAIGWLQIAGRRLALSGLPAATARAAAFG